MSIPREGASDSCPVVSSEDALEALDSLFDEELNIDTEALGHLADLCDRLVDEDIALTDTVWELLGHHLISTCEAQGLMRTELRVITFCLRSQAPITGEHLSSLLNLTIAYFQTSCEQRRIDDVTVAGQILLLYSELLLILHLTLHPLFLTFISFFPSDPRCWNMIYLSIHHVLDAIECADLRLLAPELNLLALSEHLTNASDDSSQTVLVAILAEITRIAAVARDASVITDLSLDALSHALANGNFITRILAVQCVLNLMNTFEGIDLSCLFAHACFLEAVSVITESDDTTQTTFFTALNECLEKTKSQLPLPVLIVLSHTENRTAIIIRLRLN